MMSRAWIVPWRVLFLGLLTLLGPGCCCTTCNTASCDAWSGDCGMTACGACGGGGCDLCAPSCGGCGGCDACGPCMGPLRNFLAKLNCSGGCGEVYVDEWLNDPPACCDPCDACTGKWMGARCCPPPPGKTLGLLWGKKYCGGCEGGCGSCSACSSPVHGSYDPAYVETDDVIYDSNLPMIPNEMTIEPPGPMMQPSPAPAEQSAPQARHPESRLAPTYSPAATSRRPPSRRASPVRYSRR